MPPSSSPPRPGIDFLPDNFIAPPRAPMPLWLRALLFVMIYAVLQWAWSMARGSALERAVIDVATVQSATALVNVLTPDIEAEASGPRIKAVGGGINILNGCDGTEVLFLLWAAILLAPLSWRVRVTALVLGLGWVWLLNQARVLVLFYAYRSDRDLFALLHGSLAPLALVVAIGISFMFLLRIGKADATA